jgi:hypothetical protein
MTMPAHVSHKLLTQVKAKPITEPEPAVDEPASLLTIPADVAALIMGSLDSLDDVFCLAATCRAYKKVLDLNAATIFGKVVPRSIKQLDVAQLVLSAQTGSPLTNTLTVQLGRELWLNTRVVENARREFLREVIIPGGNPRQERLECTEP